MARNAKPPTVPPTAGPMTDVEGFVSAVGSELCAPAVSLAVDVGGAPVAGGKDDIDELEVGKFSSIKNCGVPSLQQLSSKYSCSTILPWRRCCIT